MLKKKSNPARDFALTVLENDKKSVIKKVVVEQGTDNAGGSSDLNEISQLLNSTNALLTRNSHLRASLTIKVQRSNSKKTTKTTFVLPKNVVQETVEVCSSSSASPGSSTASSDKCDTSEEESMPSLEPPVNPFSRWMTFLTLEYISLYYQIDHTLFQKKFLHKIQFRSIDFCDIVFFSSP